jgi:hypothetical protein
MSKKLRWDSSAFSPRPKMTVAAQPEPQARCRQFKPQDGRVWLGRWEDDRLVAEACRLRRISQNGAVVLVESHVPEGKSVWVSLHGRGRRFGSVPARVSKAVAIAPGAVLVWLRFGVSCPAELLYAAVFGADALDATLN